MLSLAALGMFSYGVYSSVWALVDIFRGARLELWAEGGLVLFGVLLMLSAALVRIGMPGGSALAIGAMLGLQGLAVHAAAHLQSGLIPQVGRAVLAAALVLFAWLGGRRRHDGTA